MIENIKQSTIDKLYEYGFGMAYGVSDRPYLYVRDDTQKIIPVASLPGDDKDSLESRIVRAADAFEPYAFIADAASGSMWGMAASVNAFEIGDRLDVISSELASEYNIPHNVEILEMDASVRDWLFEAFPEEFATAYWMDKDLTFADLKDGREMSTDRINTILDASLVARKQRERCLYRLHAQDIEVRADELKAKYGIDPAIRALEQNGFRVNPKRDVAELIMELTYKNDVFRLPPGNLSLAEKVVFSANQKATQSPRHLPVLEKETIEQLSKAADWLSENLGIDRDLGRKGRDFTADIKERHANSVGTKTEEKKISMDID